MTLHNFTALWISCHRFTVAVEVDGGYIVRRAAPIVRKFIGQPLGNLTKWAATFGGLVVTELE